VDGRWEYVTKFGEQCTMAANQYSKECAERIFQEVGGTSWSTLQVTLPPSIDPRPLPHTHPLGPPSHPTPRPQLQSKLLNRDFGRNWTLSFAVFNPIPIIITMVERDFARDHLAVILRPRLTSFDCLALAASNLVYGIAICVLQ
jgi:hypothetical protein